MSQSNTDLIYDWLSASFAPVIAAGLPLDAPSTWRLIAGSVASGSDNVSGTPTEIGFFNSSGSLTGSNNLKYNPSTLSLNFTGSSLWVGNSNHLGDLSVTGSTTYRGLTNQVGNYSVTGSIDIRHFDRPLTLYQTGSHTINTETMLLLNHTTNQVLSGGFGSRIMFQSQDSAGTNYPQASIDARQTGFINGTARLVLRTATAGTLTDTVFINPSGHVGINGNPGDITGAVAGNLTIYASAGSATMLTLRDATNGVAIEMFSPASTISQIRGAGGDVLWLGSNNDTVGHIQIATDGRVGFGAAPATSVLLDLPSTTQAFRPPVMTTTQRDAIASPSAGMLIWNSTLGVLQDYNGSVWANV